MIIGTVPVPAQPAMGEESSMDYRDRRKKKILITDDSEMNREILTEMLGQEYEIVETENGRQAVEVMQERRGDFSVLLLDMNMPEMNGMEVLQVMKENQWIEDLPVITISAEDGAEYIHKAYEMGVSDYITRPFDAVIVHHRVSNTIALNAKKKWLAEIVDEEIDKNKQRKSGMEQLFKHVMKAQQWSEMALMQAESGKFGEVDAGLIDQLRNIAQSLDKAMEQDF